MATVHVLENQGGDNYRAVLHVPMPTGAGAVNDVGTSWQTCYLAQFLPGAPKTVLPVGNGTGQISQSEANQVGSGATMEFEFVFTDLPASANPTQAQKDANIDAVAASIRTTKLADLQARLKYYGYTRA